MRELEIVATLSAKDKEVYKVKSQGQFYILKVYPDEQAADRESCVGDKDSMTAYSTQVIQAEYHK